MTIKTRNALLSLIEGKGLDPNQMIPEDSILKDPKTIEILEKALAEPWLAKLSRGDVLVAEQDFINPKPENIYQVVYVPQ